MAAVPPMTALATFLIPSRGRPALLAETILALRQSAIDPRALHFVVRADDDDPATVDAATILRADGPVDVVIAPRGRGRVELPFMFNRMAKLARGRWVLPWTDRARLSRAWDVALEVAEIDGVALLPDAATGAVALTASAVKLLGGIAPTVRVAKWIWAVAWAADLPIIALTRAVASDYGLGEPLTAEEAAEARAHGQRVAAGRRPS